MFRFTIRTLLIVLALGPVASIAQEKTDPAEALYGEWEIVEMVFLATVQDFGERPGGWFRFGKGTFVHLQDEADRMRRVDSLTCSCVIRDGQIDIWQKTLWGDEPLLRALFELKDGKLRVVWRNDYGPRPTDFEALKDKRLTSFVLKKVK